MLIRSERPADVPEISELIADAFRRPDSPDDPVPEVGLVTALRSSDAWIPQQSLVAIVDDEIVGYCLSTRAHVGQTPALALGPLAVKPDCQQQGVGTALMHAAIDIAIDMVEPFIGLLGDYRYYQRFGFQPARELGIESPDPSWGSYFQVKPLPDYEPVAGVFSYPDPFKHVR